ncbi:MAG: GNAT family N-acetyltransferase [Promicromonosporaceae bacterium]|nr:GNAT family N-acetyltransferase [Promicromonosporaceae bacterium]
MTRFHSSLLGADHRIAEFDCGNEALNGWLRDSAGRAHAAGVSRVTVWNEIGAPGAVAAYYSLSPTQLASREGLSRSVSGGFTVVPAWLLGRLAVDRRYQHQGVGRQVLIDAIETVVSLADKAGGRLIVVDPIDQAAARWYETFGFAPFGTDEAERPARRYLRIDRAVASLRQAAKQ